jgi:hypothetical protein
MPNIRETEPADDDLDADDAAEGAEEGGLLAGIEPGALLENTRDRVVSLVTQHPIASVAGAFVLGFALARIVKAIGED